jgi:hypothetical protein
MKDQGQIAIQVASLREFHAMDRREQLGEGLRRMIKDPLKPKTSRGNLRINPILVLLAVMALLAGGTFLFFGLVQL